MGRERHPDTLVSMKTLLQLLRKTVFLFNLLIFLNKKSFWFKKKCLFLVASSSSQSFMFYRLLPVQENFLLKFQVK